MTKGRLVALTLTTCGVVALCEAGDKHYHVRPQSLRGIPARDYGYRRLSPPLVVLSERAILLREPLEPALAAALAKVNPPATPQAQVTAPARLKLFQFQTPALQIDHCVVRRPALLVDDRGTWVLSFRAEQNPQLSQQQPLAPVVNQPLKNEVLQTSQYKRNRFHVAVRGYVARPLREQEPLQGLPEPVAFAIDVPEFWVERGRPYEARLSGDNLPGLAEFFDLVDRVELEFAYEYPAGFVPDLSRAGEIR